MSGITSNPASTPDVRREDRELGPYPQELCQHHRADARKQVENVPGKISPFERSIAVKDLLEHLGAGTCLNVSSANLIEESARRRLVGMISPRDLHRNVEIHKNGQTRPDSISVSIRSINRLLQSPPHPGAF
jgi:hypothetical protein